MHGTIICLHWQYTHIAKESPWRKKLEAYDETPIYSYFDKHN